MTSELRGTSSAERTLDARQIAALRPFKENAPKQRKPAAKPAAVATGIVCFCGERFAESQALEFMKHLRAEVGEDLQWRKRHRERHRGYNRKYRANPEKMERERERNREYRRDRRTDPEYREHERGRKLTPKARERNREYNRAYRERNQERINATARERRARKKAEQEQP